MAAPATENTCLTPYLRPAVERVAQFVAVQEFLAYQRGDDGQAEVGGGALVLMQADGTFLPARLRRAADPFFGGRVSVISTASL